MGATLSVNAAGTPPARAEAERRWRSPIRPALAALLVFGAIDAVGRGYYGLTGARGLPTACLPGDPRADYLVPSVVLLVVVGGSLSTASVGVMRGSRGGRELAIAAGLLLLAWIRAEVEIVGFVSWMQPATAAAGILILGLAQALPRPTC